MAATTFVLGHQVWWRNGLKGPGWYYEDHTKAEGETLKPCKRCERLPTKEGHDSCIANLTGVWAACCGHGVHKGYAKFENGVVLRGEFEKE